MKAPPLERRRRLHALGERAVDFYVDTGHCVFCDADDVERIPHADDCDVGTLSEVVVDEARRQKKAEQRALLGSPRRLLDLSDTLASALGIGRSDRGMDLLEKLEKLTAGEAEPDPNDGQPEQGEEGSCVFEVTSLEMGLTTTLRAAHLSECLRYRYLLSRLWDEVRPSRVHFVMLNPSTADHRDDDATIRRCIGYGKRWGFAGLYVLNLYAYRATQPNKLLEVADPVGPSHDEKLRRHFEQTAHRDDWVICAWGALRKEHLAREAQVKAILADARMLVGFETRALKLTSAGFPAHPLRLRADLNPMAFEVTHV